MVRGIGAQIAFPALELVAVPGNQEECEIDEAAEVFGDGPVVCGNFDPVAIMLQGTPEQVRAEAREALAVLARGGGFILSPVDNVRENTPRARENVSTLIDEWQRLSRYRTDAPRSV